MSDPLELEIPTVVSYHVGAGILWNPRDCGSPEEQSVLSPAPTELFTVLLLFLDSPSFIL